MSPPARACAACGATVADEDRFCEDCGADLVAVRLAGRWLFSGGGPAECQGCGATDFGAEGYCDTCGQRRHTGRDRVELDLGAVAGVSDRGLRRRHNEDAMGIGHLPGLTVAVVCDGVSSTSRPDVAAHAAAEAGTYAMLAALDRGVPAADATEAAARAAQDAVRAAGEFAVSDPPSCTYVSAVVTGDAVTVGWVGDSRAYWFPVGAEPACVTTDDSHAGRLVAAGVPAATAGADPQAAALVRWLGADATDTEPHLVTFTPDTPGRVLLCTDGLSRYRPAAADLAAATPDGAPLETAQALVRLALDEGGQDNVTVVLLPYPPVDPSPASGEPSS